MCWLIERVCMCFECVFEMVLRVFDVVCVCCFESFVECIIMTAKVA